jgi:hypothetical protein
MRRQSQCLIASAALLAVAGSASAANVDWVRPAASGQGLWNDVPNWSAFPNNGDVARISGAVSSVLVDATQGTVQPGFTDVGHTSGSDNLLEITNGTFVPRFDIRLGGNSSTTTSGSARNGTVNQTGTSTVTASNVFIGFAKSGSGTYNMGGGTFTLNNIATNAGAQVGQSDGRDSLRVRRLLGRRAQQIPTAQGVVGEVEVGVADHGGEDK